MYDLVAVVCHHGTAGGKWCLYLLTADCFLLKNLKFISDSNNDRLFIAPHFIRALGA